MASKARNAFDQSCQDINRLLEIHGKEGVQAKGRRFQLEVLNKSAIVLIAAVWEAYCEDIVGEGIEHLVVHSASASFLSKTIRKAIANELKCDKDELAIWQIADNGWKAVLKSRLTRMQEVRARKLNTPKSENIRLLFSDGLGIDDISKGWKWEKMSSDQAAKKLDNYITLRGEIAHRGAAATAVTKYDVEDFLNHVKRLVAKTGKQVNQYVKQNTGKSLW